MKKMLQKHTRTDTGVKGADTARCSVFVRNTESASVGRKVTYAYCRNTEIVTVQKNINFGDQFWCL